MYLPPNIAMHYEKLGELNKNPNKAPGEPVLIGTLRINGEYRPVHLYQGTKTNISPDFVIYIVPTEEDRMRLIYGDDDIPF